VLVSVGVSVSYLRESYDSVIVAGVINERWVVPEERNVEIAVARAPRNGVTLQSVWPRVGPHYR